MKQLRWWLVDLWESAGGGSDAKVIVGLIVVLLLGVGGYLAAREVSNAGASTVAAQPTGHLVRLTTTVRDPVTVRLHGRYVVRWRTRRQVVTAQAQTVMQTQTIRTPGGTRVVSRPVIRYRVAYRSKVVTVIGKGRTRVQPVTSTLQQTVNQTVVRTVVQPVTVVQTQTVVSTETLPGQTVTLPGTTLTITLPTTT